MLSVAANLLLLSSAALAAPAPKPEGAPCLGYPSPDQYVVQGFTADTAHLSPISYYNFSLIYNPTTACDTSVTLICYGSIDVLPPLTYLGSTPCTLPLPQSPETATANTSTGVSFFWTGSAPYTRDDVSYPGGYTLTLADTYGAGYTGNISFPGSDYEVYGHSPTFDDVVIRAPSNFVVERKCA